MEDYEYMNILKHLGKESYARQQVDKVITNTYTFTHDPSVLRAARENMAKKIISTKSGNKIYVGASAKCGGKTPCYSSIQAAINAAGTGDIIRITNETYYENVKLTQNKRLN